MERWTVWGIGVQRGATICSIIVWGFCGIESHRVYFVWSTPCRGHDEGAWTGEADPPRRDVESTGNETWNNRKSEKVCFVHESIAAFQKALDSSWLIIGTFSDQRFSRKPASRLKSRCAGKALDFWLLVVFAYLHLSGFSFACCSCQIVSCT